MGDRLALCLHGFPEIGYSWRHQLPFLASLGYRVGAPDLRGFGQTDKTKGVREYAVEHLVDDFAALIDVSRTRETLLLAHDWGVMLASQIAFHQIRPFSEATGSRRRMSRFGGNPIMKRTGNERGNPAATLSNSSPSTATAK